MVVSVGINEKKQILIPDNAIRFRVIANSNSTDDQNIKMIIKDDVEKEVYNIIGDTTNIAEVRKKINNNLERIDKVMAKYDVSYKISYGNNYFPEKEYKGVTYPEGNYESLVITLGEGSGKNWWCVLFPPLCLLDEENNLDDVEYELYAKKIINKFSN